MKFFSHQNSFIPAKLVTQKTEHRVCPCSQWVSHELLCSEKVSHSQKNISGITRFPLAQLFQQKRDCKKQTEIFLFGIILKA